MTLKTNISIVPDSNFQCRACHKQALKIYPVHETNTYATRSQGKCTLDGMICTCGQGLIDKYEGTNVWGGFIDVALEQGWELVPTVHYFFEHSFGLVAAEAYAEAKREILDGIRATVCWRSATVARASVLERLPCLNIRK
jgi:hypothetical protein